MKKHKILVVALAMAVMLIGTGYAYWSQTLTIDNTVNTGNMDVQFVCQGDDAWDDGWISGHHSDLVTLDLQRSADKQKLTFTVGNFYPGAGASLDFVVKNTGSVAAKITNVTGTVTNNAALCNALNYEFNKVGLVHDGWFTYYDITPIAANNVSDLASGLSGVLDDYTLQPGDTLVLLNRFGGEEGNPGYNILMPSTISGSDFESQTGDNAAKFTLGLNFTQVN